MSLQDELKEQIAWQQKLHDKNAAPVRYGHGRWTRKVIS